MKKLVLIFGLFAFYNPCFSQSVDDINKLNSIFQSGGETISINGEEYVIFSEPIHEDFRLIMKTNAKALNSNISNGLGIVDSQQRIIVPCK